MKVFDQEVTTPQGYHTLTIRKIDEYLRGKIFASHHLPVINWAKTQLGKLMSGEGCQFGEWQVSATTNSQTIIKNMRLFLLGIAIYCETFTHSKNLIRVAYQAAAINFDDEKKLPRCYAMTKEGAEYSSMTRESMQLFDDFSFISDNREMTRQVMREATRHVGKYKVDMWLEPEDSSSKKKASGVEEKIRQHYSQRLYSLRETFNKPDWTASRIPKSSPAMDIVGKKASPGEDATLSMTFVPGGRE